MLNIHVPHKDQNSSQKSGVVDLTNIETTNIKGQKANMRKSASYKKIKR